MDIRMLEEEYEVNEKDLINFKIHEG